jgi:L-cystine uptake protein TcyP (sodium:dicarboxylate symporter family)
MSFAIAALLGVFVVGSLGLQAQAVSKQRERALRLARVQARARR